MHYLPRKLDRCEAGRGAEQLQSSVSKSTQHPSALAARLLARGGGCSEEAQGCSACRAGRENLEGGYSSITPQINHILKRWSLFCQRIFE